MKNQNLNFEREIRDTVEIGNPWAIDEIFEDICGEHKDLKNVLMELIADEYSKRLSEMTIEKIEMLYREFFLYQTDANKDWLLGEIVEKLKNKDKND